MMPLAGPVSVSPICPPSFHGLPGMLADSLPDKYGNALIDAWLATQGRTPESFNAVERLCYIGVRGMGALEFAPAMGPRRPQPRSNRRPGRLASEVLTHRKDLNASFATAEGEALREILRVGTSAGGARAKAVIAWNPRPMRCAPARSRQGRVRVLAAQVRRRHRQQGQGADGPKGYGAVESPTPRWPRPPASPMRNAGCWRRAAAGIS